MPGKESKMFGPHQPKDPLLPTQHRSNVALDALVEGVKSGRIDLARLTHDLDFSRARPLSAAEAEIMEVIVTQRGYTNAQIARVLLKKSTGINRQLQSVYNKLGVYDKVEATLAYMEIKRRQQLRRPKKP